MCRMCKYTYIGFHLRTPHKMVGLERMDCRVGYRGATVVHSLVCSGDEGEGQ